MGQNQRKFERVPVAFQVQSRRRGSLIEGWQKIVCIDLSAGGICFRSDAPYDAGETLEIRITLPGFLATLVLAGRVVRAHPLADGGTECALEFLDVDLEQQVEIDKLVQFLKKPPPA